MRLVLASLLLLPLAGTASAQVDYFAIRKSVGLYGVVYETLASEYVDAIDAEALMRSGVAAMTGSLDPYTVYYDEATAAASRLQQGGDVGGVGVVVAERGGALVVVSVLDGSDAERQGVRPGDAVVQIARQPAEGVSAQRANTLLRGEPGSEVTVEIAREGQAETLRFVLVRAGDPETEVTYSGFVEPGVGYVRLGRFLADASGQVRAAVEALQGEGELRALVLDLRGNPGGLLEQAVALSGLFLPSNSVVTETRGRAAGMDQTYRTREAPLLADTPLAVLIDRASASASEIVAGALQDHDRAVIVGETSFGKGLVQAIRPMPYGTALKLTVSRYTTPSGREIQRLTYAQGSEASEAGPGRTARTVGGREVRSGVGIEPDVLVSLGEESELERALVRSAAFLRFANRYAAERPVLAPDFRVDAALLARFRQFIEAEAEAVAYRTDAERTADALAEDLAEADYGTAEGTLAALRQAIARDKAADFERHAPRLADRLQREILSRYAGQRSQTVAALADDPVVTRARALLNDPAATARLLGR